MTNSSQNIRLSVLDQSPIREGGTPADAIRETVELAQRVEILGYHRYWLAEHHGTEGLAGPAPEIMVTRVAAATREMRVGSGGVMLSHYSPYKVAENFKVLENMYPGRIDLGVGRAPGSDHRTASALAYGSQVGIEYFPAKIRDMAAFLGDELPADHPLAGVKATPKADGIPEIWILASSEGSTTLAARFGMGLSYAHFINPVDADALLRLYRENFQVSNSMEKPTVNMGIFVLCAETEEEAERIVSTRDLHRLRADRGQHGPMPSPETAAAHAYSEVELRRIQQNRQRLIFGTPNKVKAEIEEMASRYDVDEFIILSNCYEFSARVRSYELIAEAFGLQPRHFDNS
jgi:luciferase family oxidoreductase group 1